MSPVPANDGPADVYDAAADWHERRRAPGWSPADEAALTAWLEADAQHVDAYAALAEVEAALDDAVAAGGLDRELAQARAAFVQGRARNARRNFALMAAGLSGVAVLAGLGGLAWMNAGASEQSFAAAPGRRSAVVLADGSRVVLDGGARLTARIDRRSRDIALTGGRAFFDVAHDPSRPFEVSGGGHVVRALGTAFEVDLAPGAKTYQVALLRGRVRVSGEGQPVELAPGQVLAADGQGRETVSSSDVAAATAWRDGRLVLKGDALFDAAAEINRRGGRRIVVRGSAKDLKVSGAFGGDDPLAFARAVAVIHGLTIGEAADGSIVLSPAKDAGATAD
ncbi:FecR domain-containing protein [Caulobacter sp. CCNWLY153]|uniref:FecR family protein n=1 Tax=unclassified Caulobacter TaxID=2648921 RepID=UPI002FF36BEF